ncbi:Uncharacterised protein [Mycobacteroides abscessus subsp. abscessus]|nr:Uncharacterised protein [Mycobacteroides abscessus subsp. abscessus]
MARPISEVPPNSRMVWGLPVASIMLLQKPF